ncbi:methyltransferase domain-containing protein [Actinomadura rudentiformis]|uniref:Protein-L-isoaspartate O-methyltransferase n=1 Tax=Actinomadura rudentiformis TaxID=359158 RepID=A0A6H9Y997_9ACTN|nr:methyltransferase domain-containing protein [Actinomadura rudentiformis]KAB2339211.1 methyltransferase domain-containing protein [Actinomadura rudentiformis]
MGDVVQRIEAMANQLAVDGWLTREKVRAALHDVPRHAFVPRIAWTGQGDRVDRDIDPDGWLDLAYAQDAIITQLDDGASDAAAGAGMFTSSCSAPSTVVSLLELLSVERGHRVLEIGTGTGWTAGLLAQLAGEDNVVSVEIDPQIADQAADNLQGAGLSPRLIVGDGMDGWPQATPYDRVHVTCGVRVVPHAWVEQTRPGGVIVLPYSPGFGYGHELRLVVMPDGTAVGRFPGYASYMMSRSQRRPELALGDLEASRSRTALDPRTIAFAAPGADLAMSAVLGEVFSQSTQSDGRYTLWLWSTDGSWAKATYEQGKDAYDVEQAGDRSLWNEVEAAYFQWVTWREPGRDRFGMTVTPEGQTIWLDSPDNPIPS